MILQSKKKRLPGHRNEDDGEALFVWSGDTSRAPVSTSPSFFWLFLSVFDGSECWSWRQMPWLLAVSLFFPCSLWLHSSSLDFFSMFVLSLFFFSLVCVFGSLSLLVFFLLYVSPSPCFPFLCFVRSLGFFRVLARGPFYFLSLCFVLLVTSPSFCSNVLWLL